MTDSQRLDKLEKQLEQIRLETDVVHAESLRRRILQGVIFSGILDTDLSDINETTSGIISGTPWSVDHAEIYDKRLRITIDGVPYYIGLYNA